MVADLTVPLEKDAIIVIDPYPLADSTNFQLSKGSVPLHSAERWLSKELGADVKLEHHHGDRFTASIDGAKQRDLVEIKVHASRKRASVAREDSGKLHDGLRERKQPHRGENEAEAGFAISVYDQRHIEDAAHERFGLRWGDKEDRERAQKDGMVDAEGRITQKGWDQLGDDIGRIEVNSMKWLRKRFLNARDDGHDQYDDLVGNVWFDPTDYEQARLIELASDTGRHERIDMIDTSFGDLGDVSLDGVSWFGGLLLGGAIYFFDVKAEDMETLTATLDAGEKRERAKRKAR